MNIQEFKLLGERARHDYISANFPANNRSIAQRKPVFGVGVNDSLYVTNPRIDGIQVIDPCYDSWASALRRCHSVRWHEEHKTYACCSIDSDWITFSVFREWWLDHQVDGWSLDKDILFIGNKLYSEHTCVFVTAAVNTFVTDRGADRGEHMIGCYWKKSSGKFSSQCWNPITGKREHLGYFTSELDAHLAWKNRKLELAPMLCAQFPSIDERILPALIDRYS